jgi:hypothetical protein
VVVIASSDSDFAPLVQRLREKGCVVRGIGQKGKTGDETQDVYDDYTVLEHHKTEPAPRKAPARKRATAKPAAEPVAAEPARKAAARKRTSTKAAVAAPAPVEPAVDTAAPPAPEPAPKPTRTTARKTSKARKTEAPPPPPPAADPRTDAVLAALPELAAGQSLALNVAVQRLREAQVLGRNTPSTKFFAALADRFELLPAGKPTQVRLRA